MGIRARGIEFETTWGKLVDFWCNKKCDVRGEGCWKNLLVIQVKIGAVVTLGRAGG